MQKIISSIVVASLALGISSAAWAKRVPVQNTQQQNTGLSATERVNRQVVVDFYQQVFQKHQVEAAVKQHIGKEYIQHNPHVGDGTAPFVAYFVPYFQQNPQARSEIKRVIVQGDLVVLHVLSREHPQDRGTAVVDIFRVKDGKIVEHWDVQQAVPEDAANSNTMF